MSPTQDAKRRIGGLNVLAGQSVHRHECVLQLLVERRHDAIHHVRHEEQHVVELVKHGGTLRALRLCLPCDRDLFTDLCEGGSFFVGCEGRVQSPDEQPADGLLFLEQRAARGLGRMGGEDRLEPQALEQPVYLGGTGRDRAVTQGVFETAFLWRRCGSSGPGTTEVVAAPANAWTRSARFHLEIRRERVDQLACALGSSAPTVDSSSASPPSSPSRRRMAATRAVSTAWNSGSPPCSRITSPTSAPIVRTSSRSAASFSVNRISRRGWVLTPT
jgi:hypothetical protein